MTTGADLSAPVKHQIGHREINDMTKLQTITWVKQAAADGKPAITESFDVQRFVKDTLVKLGKKYAADGTPLSHGLSNVQHVAMLELAVHEVGSLMIDANEPTKAERQARVAVIQEIGVNTSQSRQSFEKAGLLVKSEGARQSIDAMALLGE